MPTREEKNSLLDAAYDYVHTDEQTLLKQCTAEHAIVNLGQTPFALVPGFRPSCAPATLLEKCFDALYHDCESDEMAASIGEERQGFVDDVRRDIQLVKDAGLPLSVRNCRMAFLCEGPFAKKTKKEKKKKKK